jgi:hypothetical protein
MIIYANGDSVVAGTELIDESIPGFPGYYTDLPDANNIAKNFEWKNKFPFPDRNKELELSFPNRIAKHFGLEVRNDAQPGASIERIVRNTIVDLLFLKKSHEKIIAIVGNTEPQRFALPNGTDQWQNHFLTIPVKDRHVSNVQKFKLEYETHYHRELKFFEYMILLKDFCRLNNIDLYLVDTLIYPFFNPESYDLALFKEYANIDYACSMADLSKRVGEAFCPQGHYSKHVHDLASRKLIKILETKL